MDDLAGLNWTSTVSNSQAKPANAPTPTNANYFPTLKPTPPTSGRSTPNPQARAGLSGPSKTGTPANDSFANLVPFGASQPIKQISLQEQQKALQEQRAKSLGFQSAQWTGGSGLGSGGSSPARALSPAAAAVGSREQQRSALSGNGTFPLKQSVAKEESEADILAAFNSSAPVDASSHFPPSQERSTSTGPSQIGIGDFSNVDDDDPFGLGTGSIKSSGVQAQAAGGDDDDVLGLLGKPVSELSKRPKSREKKAEKRQTPRDKAVAELVDMGFTPDKAADALATTDTGTDVQAAVGWLLNQAHAESSGKASRGPRDSSARGRRAEPDAAWDRIGSDQRRDNHQSTSNGTGQDAARSTSELRSNFLKTANSLWKTGQKKFNKAVADFNAEGDPTQPRWMREAHATAAEDTQPRRQSNRQGSEAMPARKPSQPADLVDMTDEAMMLESGGGRLNPKSNAQASRPTAVPSRPEPQHPTSRPRQPPQSSRPNSRFVEDQSPQAYVSPARRRKPQPKPASDQPDLLLGGSEARSQPAAAAPKAPVQSRRPPPPRPAASTTPRPKAPPRNIPHISTIALQSSTSHRLKGNEAFKLGNYGEATTAYTNSLRDIPNKHPLSILLLTNRALTHLKTGDPKAAITDAESAIEIIGPSRGQDESVDIGGSEGSKPMAPFWGRAVMRRAEALEQLERWADAGKAWAECVQAGVGGSQAIQARNRCEQAGAPKPKPAPRPVPKKAIPKPKARSAMDDLNGHPKSATTSSAEAVIRLRAANAAAEKADDEKFALADSVDARLLQWRKGKESNLRALLGSLDTVLWEGANWKKIGMSELIVPGKVKIAYMKGIAKVHPDKVCLSWICAAMSGNSLTRV